MTSAAGAASLHLMSPTYTPYDGSSPLFAIGLSPLDPQFWFEPDDNLGPELTEKRRLVAEHGDEVLRAERDTDDAQREVLERMVLTLTTRHPHIYRRDGNRIHLAGHTVDLADETILPLHRAGLLVQDDLVIMRRGENGWRLAAAFLAFPSSWELSQKFGKVMDEVHAPVPGFEGGSRNAELINRMFDRLQPGHPVRRMNWSINWRHALYHPQSLPAETVEVVPARDAVIRVERQTLTKLPVCGDILFTIRIYLDPLAAILAEPDAQRLGAGMADQLERLTIDEAKYKGVHRKRAELLMHLRQIQTPPVRPEGPPSGADENGTNALL
ncbi:heme-dependent oxidative N-demethylase family protein [Neorhizobium sp. NPDC001467]|uniref:heme-dependent oxidative N-demethylase family protein n=1 Tax=Neorhizobium sp. NPDC001467 TaxID=3390595 RepID=UPI003D061734